jgi:hypothetical protein
MESGHAFHALGHPAPVPPPAFAVAELNIVMVFRPVETYENLPHQHLLASVGTVGARGDRSALMVKCSSARHPTSRSVDLTTKRRTFSL